MDSFPEMRIWFILLIESCLKMVYTSRLKSLFILKMVDFKPFSILKTLSWRGQTTRNVLFQCQTFYDILCHTCKKPTAKARLKF